MDRAQPQQLLGHASGRAMLVLQHHRGMSLIELVITLVIFSSLVGLAAPSFIQLLQNMQIRTAADTLLQGLQFARAEAVRRNTLVSFTLVDSINPQCKQSPQSLNWVVSVGDPNGGCPINADNTNNIQSKIAAEGTPNVSASATGGSVAVFNGLGRLTSAGFTQIDLTNPSAGNCAKIGNVNLSRCLRIVLNTSGLTRICDPAVDQNDPRHC